MSEKGASAVENVGVSKIWVAGLADCQLELRIADINVLILRAPQETRRLLIKLEIGALAQTRRLLRGTGDFLPTVQYV